MSADWHKVAAASEITEDEPKGVEIGGKHIAVFKLGDKFHATDNVCPHAFALLTDGFVDDGAVECPLHAAKFDIATGKCLAEPAEDDLATYEVKLEGGDILVRVPGG
ncbi:MAG: nitrite reductase small subunit NirD [Alphaproteobacteria bacterium]